jgi:hypothetical protein
MLHERQLPLRPAECYGEVIESCRAGTIVKAFRRDKSNWTVSQV